MRINQFVATASGESRRASDQLIVNGRVTVNGKTASLGQQITVDDIVKLDGKVLQREERLLIMLNKPTGYVCSRDGQGSPTIYELLPKQYHHLKTIGRLDKDSSGLILLTNDGQLAQKLTHPKYQKEKIYEIEIDKLLTKNDKAKIEQGIKVEDYVSKFNLSGSDKAWTVTISQGKNRQIRRSFTTLDYKVIKLHRTQFGNYKLQDLEKAKIIQL